MFKIFSFESKLPNIFQRLGELHKNISGRITAENWKDQVQRLLRIWEGWSIYPPNFFKGLHTTFTAGKSWEETQRELSEEGNKTQSVLQAEGTTEGQAPMEEEDIDGVPFEEDIDGIPI